MKKLMFMVIIFFSIIITGCGSNSQKQVDVLKGEAEQYVKQSDYTNAIKKYEKIIKLSDDKQYQTKIEDLTKKQVNKLEGEAKQYTEQNDYTNAIQKYEEIIKLSDEKQYQLKIDELKAKSEKNEKDIKLVNKILDELRNVLKNPDSLKVNKVIINRHDEFASIYMDYSAMNGFGGYNRDYAYGDFMNEELMADSFFPSFESNYRSAEKDIQNNDENTYYFDLSRLEKNK